MAQTRLSARELGDGGITTVDLANLAVTDAKVATANKDGAAATPSMRTLGTGALQAAAGNDPRLNDTRAPSAHTHGNISNVGAIGVTAGLPIITGASGILQVGSFGITAGTFTQGNDARLSNARNIIGGVLGSIPYQSALNTTAMLAPGTANYFLKSNGNAAPSWQLLDMTFLPDASFKKSVRVGSTANLAPVSFSAGVMTGPVGVLTIDGIAVALNDRVLLKDQTSTLQNGIYYVSTLGTVGAAWVLTRTPGANISSELAGAFVNVDSGATNGGFLFDTDFKSTDTINSSPVIWSRVVDTGLASTVVGSTLGTAAIGTSLSYARADHVHPLQTTVSGNAGSATILQNARTINGVSFNGSANITITAAASDVSAWAKAAVKPSYTFAEIGTKPTTLAGYGITDASINTHTHTFASITSRPTTLSGYGISETPWTGLGYITSGASITGSARRLEFIDGPRTLADRLPNSMGRTVNFDFVNANIFGGTGSYGGVMTFAPFDGNTASTGDSSYQLAFLNETGVNGSGVPGLKLRKGIDTTWGAWYSLLTPGNISNYSPSLIGVGASGTWPINITGYAPSSGTIESNPNRTDANSYPIVWTNGSAFSPNYSCSAVTITSSVGRINASSFSGAGTGLTGTASGLSIGGSSGSTQNISFINSAENIEKPIALGFSVANGPASVYVCAGISVNPALKSITADLFKKSGGTSAQYLMADGSVSTGGSGWDLGFNSNFNGYQKFSNGLIIQWGSGSVSSTTLQNNTFPIAFPTVCLNVVATEAIQINTYTNINITALSTTGYCARKGTTADTGTFRYIAVGY